MEDEVFGNNAAVGCHLANYSYFHRTVATWDASGGSHRDPAAKGEPTLDDWRWIAGELNRIGEKVNAGFFNCGLADCETKAGAAGGAGAGGIAAVEAVESPLISLASSARLIRLVHAR